MVGHDEAVVLVLRETMELAAAELGYDPEIVHEIIALVQAAQRYVAATLDQAQGIRYHGPRKLRVIEGGRGSEGIHCRAERRA